MQNSTSQELQTLSIEKYFFLPNSCGLYDGKDDDIESDFRSKEKMEKCLGGATSSSKSLVFSGFGLSIEKIQKIKTNISY